MPYFCSGDLAVFAFLLLLYFFQSVNTACSFNLPIAITVTPITIQRQLFIKYRDDLKIFHMEKLNRKHFLTTKSANQNITNRDLFLIIGEQTIVFSLSDTVA